MTDLATTNVWLAILTLAVVLQTAMMIAAIVVILRVARRVDEAATKAAAAFEPMAARISIALDDLNWLISVGRKADDSVRTAASELGDTIRRARGLMLGRVLPVVGVIRAARAVFSAFSARRAHRTASGQTEEDRRAVNNFISEGAPVGPATRPNGLDSAFHGERLLATREPT